MNNVSNSEAAAVMRLTSAVDSTIAQFQTETCQQLSTVDSSAASAVTQMHGSMERYKNVIIAVLYYTPN